MTHAEERQVVYQPLFDFDVRYIDKVGREIVRRIIGASSPGRALIRFDHEIPADSRIKILGVRKIT